MSASQERAPALHAIVVTYRRPETLFATLDAYGRQREAPDTTLIVDNGADTEVGRLATERPSTTYLKMHSNAGPAGAIAAGMAHVLGSAGPDDWVLLIDDDDPPPLADALSRLREYSQTVPADVAAVGLTGTRFDRTRGRLRRVMDHELDALTDVDCIAGGQMPLYRLRAIRAVGVFDPGLFFGLEELEYGLRLRRAGWRIVVPADLTLAVREVHGRLNLGTFARSPVDHPDWRRYYSARNLVVIAAGHGTWVAPMVVVCRSLSNALRFAVVHRRMRTALRIVQGTFDGCVRRMGLRVLPGVKG